MKYIVIMFLMVSCATKETPRSSNHIESNKNKYLQEFYKLKEQLDLQTKICKQYSYKNLSQVLQITNSKSKSKIEHNYSFKNRKKVVEYLQNYKPQQFDWYLSAKIKNLYLSYPKIEEISKEHLEISNSLKDCSNEFDNLSFLNTALAVWSDTKSSKRHKLNAKKAFNRYFNYISAQEVSLLNILVTNTLLQKLEKKNIIKFMDKDKYLADSREMELLYTKTGQQILNLFQNKKYADIYDQDKKLRTAKILFKKKIMNSYLFK